MTETTTSPATGEDGAASSGREALRERARALRERTARLTAAERPKAELAPVEVQASPKKGKGKGKGGKVTEETGGIAAELGAELAELRKLREQMQQERGQAALASRVEYARRSGLRSGISDDVARTLMQGFDLDSAAGKQAFESFRRSNPAMFQEAYDANKARRTTEERLNKSEKRKNTLFGDKFIKDNLARNLR